jgi:hypothetical protein
VGGRVRVAAFLHECVLQFMVFIHNLASGYPLISYNMDFMWFLAFIKRILHHLIPLVTGVSDFAGDPAFAGVIPVASISTFTSLSAVEGTLPVAIQYMYRH